jgi:hypothetical protein
VGPWNVYRHEPIQHARYLYFGGLVLTLRCVEAADKFLFDILVHALRSALRAHRSLLATARL